MHGQRLSTPKIGKIVYHFWEVTLANKIGAVTARNLKYSEYILEHIGKSSVVLDVGCGVGPFSVTCAKKGVQVVSMDFDSEVLRYVPKIEGINRICCNAQNLPIKPESVDLVLAISILEHLKNPELALGEFQQVLRARGLLIIQMPNIGYFIEPHTKFPLIFLLPSFIKDKINLQTFVYYYINFSLSIKRLLRLLLPLFVVKEIKPYYHRLKTPPWPPSWIILAQKKLPNNLTCASRRER